MAQWLVIDDHERRQARQTRLRAFEDSPRDTHARTIANLVGDERGDHLLIGDVALVVTAIMAVVIAVVAVMIVVAVVTAIAVLVVVAVMREQRRGRVAILVIAVRAELVARLRVGDRRRVVAAEPGIDEATLREAGVRRIGLGAIAIDEAAELARRLALAFASDPVDRLILRREQVAVERAFFDVVKRGLVGRHGQRVVRSAQRDLFRRVVRVDAREQTRADPALAVVVELVVQPVRREADAARERIRALVLAAHASERQCRIRLAVGVDRARLLCVRNERLGARNRAANDVAEHIATVRGCKQIARVVLVELELVCSEAIRGEAIRGEAIRGETIRGETIRS